MNTVDALKKLYKTLAGKDYAGDPNPTDAEMIDAIAKDAQSGGGDAESIPVLHLTPSEMQSDGNKTYCTIEEMPTWEEFYAVFPKDALDDYTPLPVRLIIRIPGEGEMQFDGTITYTGSAGYAFSNDPIHDCAINYVDGGAILTYREQTGHFGNYDDTLYLVLDEPREYVCNLTDASL